MSETIDFITHGPARSMSFMFALAPFPLQVHGGKEGAQADAAHTAGLCRSWGTVRLSNPQSPRGKFRQTCPAFDLEGDIFIILDTKQICLLSQKEIFPLSSTAVPIYTWKDSAERKAAMRSAEIHTTREALSPNFSLYIHETLRGCYPAPGIPILFFKKCSLCFLKNHIICTVSPEPHCECQFDLLCEMIHSTNIYWALSSCQTLY